MGSRMIDWIRFILDITVLILWLVYIRGEEK